MSEMSSGDIHETADASAQTTTEPAPAAAPTHTYHTERHFHETSHRHLLPLLDVAWLLLMLLAAALIAGLIYGAFYKNGGAEIDYPRQVTNITYAGLVTNLDRSRVVQSVNINDANAPSPVCKYDGRDLFNPTGAATAESGAGSKITFVDNQGVQQSISLPSGMVHEVRSPGHTATMKFVYDKVMFYYDQFYDGLWLHTHAAGPKDQIQQCLRAISPVDRLRIGLRYVVLFEPKQGGVTTQGFAVSGSALNTNSATTTIHVSNSRGVVIK